MAQPFQQKKQPTQRKRHADKAQKTAKGDFNDLGSAKVERLCLSKFAQCFSAVLLSRPREGFRGRPRRQNVLVYEAVRAWVKPLKLLTKTARPTRGGRPGGRGFGVRSAHRAAC
jgi:hypothetical protein